MAHPFKSSTSRRYSSTKVVFVSIFVALAAYAAITSLGDQIDRKRIEQLRLAHFDNDVTTVLSDLDSLLLGENVDSLIADRKQMRATLDAIVKNGAERETEGVVRAFGEFDSSMTRQIGAVTAHRMAEARRLDLQATDPAFERLKDALSTLDLRLQSEAAFLTLTSNLTVGMALVVSALLVSSLLIRFRKKVESIFTLEVQQRSVESSERRLKSLVQNNLDVIATVTSEGVFTMVSDASERAWGRLAATLVGRSVADLMDSAEATRLRRALADSMASGASMPSLELEMKSGEGTPKSFEVQVSNLLEDPAVRAMLLTFHDLTERKKYESQLTYHAFHDRLTTLPNRALFLDRLAHRLKAQENDGKSFSVLFIDLDNFKVINDSLGHEAGDTLLVEVASRLLSSVGPVDTVARLGGDEFTIILDETSSVEEATATVERIQKALLEPLALAEREVFVTCSIGVVMTATSGPDAASVLRDADTAMYQAKGNGKASLAVFEAGMNALALNRLELESDLRIAIQEGQFFLSYQPIVDIGSGKLREVEALIRWQHPTRGVIPPTAFIPLAEETGLVCPIGRWALREACAQLELWNGAMRGDDRLRLSVNVSARQLQEKDFVQEVEAVLEETGVDPSLVELEITETAMLNDLGKMKTVFSQLRELGFRVAIDDFGTGYSSMAYLSQLPVDTLKIDRSFVLPLGSDERAGGVVQAMITMARTLGLGITGEGVETQEQLSVLQGMGCDLGQGFLFDKPLGTDSMTQLILRSANAEPQVSIQAA